MHKHAIAAAFDTGFLVAVDVFPARLVNAIAGFVDFADALAAFTLRKDSSQRHLFGLR